MKEMKYIKITIIIFILISIPFLAFYSFINGVPFGGLIAKVKSNNYAKVIYGEDVTISKPQYNLKNTAYGMKVIGPDDQLITKLRYSLFKNRLFDEKINQHFSNQLKNDFEKIRTVFPDSIKVKPPGIHTTISADGNYSVKKNGLTLFHKIYVSYENWDTEIHPDESMKKPAEITRKLIDAMGEDYEVTGVQIWYTDINGAYEIISNESNTEDLYDGLVAKVKKKIIGSEQEELIKKIKSTSK